MDNDRLEIISLCYKAKGYRDTGRPLKNGCEVETGS